GDANYTNILPQKQCNIDAEAGMQLATLLAGQNVGTPMTVVVYPNGTYTVIHGYDPAAIAKALKG
ncbi:MAG: DsbA family protein, partial [Pyrobaculum sp.]